eukprot:COSAG03_NODE_1904_length_3374_cov_6.721527_1_plen_82_part_10
MCARVNIATGVLELLRALRSTSSRFFHALASSSPSARAETAMSQAGSRSQRRDIRPLRPPPRDVASCAVGHGSRNGWGAAAL